MASRLLQKNGPVEWTCDGCGKTAVVIPTETQRPKWYHGSFGPVSQAPGPYGLFCSWACFERSLGDGRDNDRANREGI